MNYKLQTSSNMHQQAQSRTSSKQETKYEQVQNKKIQTTNYKQARDKHRQAQASTSKKASKGKQASNQV